MFLPGEAWSDGDTVAIKCEVMKEGIWRVLLVLVLARAASSQLARAEASLAMEEDQKEDKTQKKQGELAPSSNLDFVRDLKDLNCQVKGGLKVKCEVQGSLLTTKFCWFRNKATLKEEPGRVKVKDCVKGTKTRWSILRFCGLEK